MSSLTSKNHWSDDIAAISFDVEGAVLLDCQEDGVVGVQIRFHEGSRESLIAALRGAEEQLAFTWPHDRRASLMEPDAACLQCKHPQKEHVAKGGSRLECPNRCPGCEDIAIHQGVNEYGDISWVAEGWRDPGELREQSVGFCPFCGFDLRGWA